MADTSLIDAYKYEAQGFLQRFPFDSLIIVSLIVQLLLISLAGWRRS